MTNECYHKGFIDGRISIRYEIQDKIRELIKKYRILNNGQIEGLYNKEILALQELLENIKEENS